MKLLGWLMIYALAGAAAPARAQRWSRATSRNGLA